MRWLQSEGSEDELVFVPEDEPLPPARGRLAIEPRPDGSFAAFAPGPVDVPVETDALSGWEIASAEPRRITLRRAPRPRASP